MRRKEKEITDRGEIDRILASAKVGHLGLVDDGKPYSVPVFFGYDGSAVYIHSAKSGRKIDALRKNTSVFFTATSEMEILSAELACSFSSRYRCAMMEATAELVDEPEAKKRGLDAIMRKYAEDDIFAGDGEETFEYDPRQLERTLLIRLIPRSVTGKKSG